MPSAADGVPLQVTAVDIVGHHRVRHGSRARLLHGRAAVREGVGRRGVGPAVRAAAGVFGARSRVVTLRLGPEEIELTEYLAPRGRPMPDRPPRRTIALFQHIAIIVSDMAKAYARLRKHGVEHASTGPQRLPDWNPNAGGISAFYFRDPDRHFLEIICVSRRARDSPKWHAATTDVFLGIDHTAIVVDDTERVAALLSRHAGPAGRRRERELRRRAGAPEQRVRRAAADHRASGGQGPGIELLEYLAPRDGRPAPADLRANDIAHWQTTLSRSGSIRCWASPAIIGSLWCRRDQWTLRRCLSVSSPEP